ncbi:MAG: DUF5689 domain-containing protein [Clostridium sp.]|nr:DUF5689 domain-containing protein [Bacteroides sp.]MCM1198255.1 DUF5689 domain-containing protein [Clostridium sp.]
MKFINNIISAFAIASCLASCQEFEPVFTGKYPEPEPWQPVHMEPTHTIAELAAMYNVGSPWVMDQDIVIAGKVSTSDQPGNFYKSFYIQDGTGGIELKVGKNGLYNDYLPGQTVYVKCNGLSLGMYGYKSGNYGGNGMVQIGFVDESGEYETSYIENPLIIDMHILRGELGDKVQPVEITESQLPSATATLATCRYIGQLVTLKGLKYAGETFTLLYLDSNKNKKDSGNRVFLSDQTWGITTWAMSESKMKEYLNSGAWDSCNVGNAGDYNYGTVGDLRAKEAETGKVQIERAAYSVSQYFKMGNTEIQIRTSGYSKFCDAEIDPDVLAGNKSIDVTGILTMYQGAIQFILIDLDGVKVN